METIYRVVVTVGDTVVSSPNVHTDYNAAQLEVPFLDRVIGDCISSDKEFHIEITEETVNIMKE